MATENTQVGTTVGDLHAVSRVRTSGVVIFSVEPPDETAGTKPC